MASTRLDLSFGIARDLGTILVQMVREFLLRQAADFVSLSPLLFQGQDAAKAPMRLSGGAASTEQRL